MNKSKFVALLVGLAGLAAALPAAAQSSFYFGGSIGNTEMKEGVCTGYVFCDRSDTNWSGNAGFMFTPNWGIELAYRDWGRAIETNDGVGSSSEVKIKSGEAVIVGAIPIYALSIYGKFGAYYAKHRQTSTYATIPNGDASNRQWTYGLGVRYDIMKHLAVRAEWQRYNNVGSQDIGFVSDADLISGGIIFVF